MYADKMTDSMKQAIDETKRRRKIQEEYNEKNNIVPKTINKEIREIITNTDLSAKKKTKNKPLTKKEQAILVESIEEEMKEAARNLDFERAMELRDILFEMKSK